MRLPEAKAMELTEQESVRSSMLFCWLIKIDDGDARLGAKCWQEIEEKAIRLGNLVVHMHHEDKVHGTDWQPRIVRFAEHRGYVVQMLTANPFLKLPQSGRHHVLGQNAPSWLNTLRYPDRIIACAGA